MARRGSGVRFAAAPPRAAGRRSSVLISLGALIALSSCSPSDNTVPPQTPPSVERSAAAPDSAAPVNTAPVNTAPTTTTPVNTAVVRPLVAGVPNFTALVQKEGPAVVNVTASRMARTVDPRRQGRADDPLSQFYRRFSPAPAPDEDDSQAREGVGSGFIISADGYILTNAHVVADADDVTVRLADAKRQFKAKVIGIDRRTDVAVLKVQATGLPTVTLGKSSGVQVGEWVAAIGSPFGFANTITAGIVSATGRDLSNESFVPFIQTDVAVNPGNSGGPLLNLNGEVIGINSMIYSRTGGYMGVSFAIPIDIALQVSDQLRAQGRVTRGRLGVTIQEVSPELAKSFGLAEPRGVIVAAIERGSAADRAGLRAGDIVLNFDGQAVERSTELPRLVASAKPGATARVTVWRNGAELSVPVTIGEGPIEPVAIAESTPAVQPPNAIGLAVSELPLPQRKALNIPYGLQVEAVQGPAENTPIQRGDVIIAVNAIPFASRAEFEAAVTRARGNGVIALLVRRGAASLYIPVNLS